MRLLIPLTGHDNKVGLCKDGAYISTGHFNRGNDAYNQWNVFRNSSDKSLWYPMLPIQLGMAYTAHLG